MFFKESVCVYIQSRYPVLQKHLRIQCGIFLNGNLKQESMTLVEENVIFTWRRAFQFKDDNWLCAWPHLRWRHAKDVAPAPQGPLISILTPAQQCPQRSTHAPGCSHRCSVHTGLFSPLPTPVPGALCRSTGLCSGYFYFKWVQSKQHLLNSHKVPGSMSELWRSSFSMRVHLFVYASALFPKH